MIQTNLFIDDPEVEDSSLTHLSKDSQTWSEEIITKLKERIPSVAHFSLSLKMMKKNEEMGAGTGAVTITNGQKSMIVPVIIKDFSMFPLDLSMIEGKIIPLNERNFNMYFNDGGESAFNSLLEYPIISLVDRYMRGENLQNTIFPPNWGRYAFASDNSALENESLLKEIEGTFDGSNLLAEIRKDLPVLSNFYNNGSMDILKFIDKQKPINAQEFRTSVDNLAHRTIHVLTKEGPNKYSILSTAHNNFNPAISHQNFLKASDFISSLGLRRDSLHDIDQTGEKIITVFDENNDNIFIASPDKEIPENINSFCHCLCRGKTGVSVEGIVIPHVIDFKQQLQPIKLFLGKTLSSLQPQIAGVKLKYSEWYPQGEIPKVGQTGTFIYRENDKGAVATLPVTVKSIFHTAGCYVGFHMRAIQLDGTPITIYIEDSQTSGIERQQITEDTSEKMRRFVIPSSMEWIPMQDIEEVASNTFNYHLTIEEANNPLPKLELRKLGQDVFSLKGADKYIEKMGWDKESLSPTQTKFLLASLGASATKVASVIQSVQKTKYIKLAAKSLPSLWDEKVASCIPEAKKMFKIAESLRCNLTKEASYIQNTQTVDSILSLNFVNPENIAKFINKIPLLKSALSHLASCLLASRLGIKEIPEQSTSNAIHKLEEVIKGLEALRATQGQQKI